MMNQRGDVKEAVKVTVLITLYNKGAFVEEAVRSILEGSFRDLDLLVVDDGSTDDGPAKLRGIQDPRLRLVMSERNLGRPFAANRGYEEARGQYLAILDADDIAAPDRLERQVAFMDANPEVGVSGSWVHRFGSVDDIIEAPCADREIRALRLFWLPVTYGSCIIRRSVMEQHRLRADTGWRWPGFDYFMLLQFAPHTAYANIPEVLTHYRIGEQNMRAGRDPVVDRTRRLEKGFAMHGVPTSDDGPHLLALLEPYHEQYISARTIFRIHAWIQRTIQLNRERKLFDEELFEAHLQHLWGRLQRRMWQLGPWPALAYMVCSRRFLPRVLVKSTRVYVRRKLLGRAH